MKKKYYKVVIHHNDRNPVSSAASKGWEREYKLNEWTTGSKDTRLFVFDSLENAENYAPSHISTSTLHEIYECECIGVIKDVYGEYSSIFYIKFWHYVNKNLKNKKKWNFNLHKNKGLMFSQPLEGACFAKSVKLIKRIK
jgi:hypothetical protein